MQKVKTLESYMTKPAFKMMNALIQLTAAKGNPEAYQDIMRGIIRQHYHDIIFRLQKLLKQEKIKVELYHKLRIKLDVEDLQEKLFKKDPVEITT